MDDLIYIAQLVITFAIPVLVYLVMKKSSSLGFYVVSVAIGLVFFLGNLLYLEASAADSDMDFLFAIMAAVWSFILCVVYAIECWLIRVIANFFRNRKASE